MIIIHYFSGIATVMSVFHVLFSVPNHIYFSKYAFRLLPIIITQDSERLYLQGPLLIYIIASRSAMHNWKSVNLSEYLLTTEKESLMIFFRNFIILFFFRHILLTNILYNELIKSKKTTVVFKTLFMAVGLRLTITF